MTPIRLPAPLVLHPPAEEDDIAAFIAEHQLGPALARHAAMFTRYFPGQQVAVTLEDVGDEYETEATLVFRVVPDATMLAREFLAAARQFLAEWWHADGRTWTDYVAFHLL
jgi:hypothetical protein